jgi:hypothetical protein
MAGKNNAAVPQARGSQKIAAARNIFRSVCIMCLIVLRVHMLLTAKSTNKLHESRECVNHTHCIHLKSSANHATPA